MKTIFTDPRELGSVVISRSPVVHPGDSECAPFRTVCLHVFVDSNIVQRVYAVGKPPPNKLCFFRNLKNVVVLPSVGERVLVHLIDGVERPSILGDRSMASCLGGGDLDG